MKTYQLPKTGRNVSSVILGLMRIKAMSNSEIQQLVGAAREAGVNVFDHADIYGGERHRCEARFGEAVSFTAAERSKAEHRHYGPEHEISPTLSHWCVACNRLAPSRGSRPNEAVGDRSRCLPSPFN
ncbi:MAG: putative aldo-keto reductase/oxidoreductase [Hyphomicrobiales bacterium]|nr:putative aldo-keto reductase/oxidoreductase [Hyphomicrobiales bacterium]